MYLIESNVFDRSLIGRVNKTDSNSVAALYFTKTRRQKMDATFVNDNSNALLPLEKIDSAVVQLSAPAGIDRRSKAAPNVSEADENDDDDQFSDGDQDDDDDDDAVDDQDFDDDERCMLDWAKVSPTTPRSDYVYAGGCEYSIDRSTRCFLCMARLKFAHVLTHRQCDRLLVGADCLERLLANHQAVNQCGVEPKSLNRMLKLLAGPWTRVPTNQLSIAKRFRAGSAWSRVLAAGKSVEIRCGVARNDPKATWAGFRTAGERALRFFDNLRFPQCQQVCAVAFPAPRRDAKLRVPRSFGRQRFFVRKAYRQTAY
mgnify:CR=1 FL=1